jgi:hypothetical protein
MVDRCACAVNAQRQAWPGGGVSQPACADDVRAHVEEAIFGKVRENRYDHYLKSEAWKRTRALVLHRANYRCEGCGIRDATEAHHTTYAHLGNEFLWELKAVCEFCHQRFHAEKKAEASR